MDDYKRALLMRIRDRLMDPQSFHDSICYEFLREIGIEKGSYLPGSAPGLSFLEDLLPEMDELFDSKQWSFYEEKAPIFNDGYDYWWSPCNWTELRIAMIDFLLNNR